MRACIRACKIRMTGSEANSWQLFLLLLRRRNACLLVLLSMHQIDDSPKVQVVHAAPKRVRLGKGRFGEGEVWGVGGFGRRVFANFFQLGRYRNAAL